MKNFSEYNSILGREHVKSFSQKKKKLQSCSLEHILGTCKNTIKMQRTNFYIVQGLIFRVISSQFPTKCKGQSTRKNPNDKYFKLAQSTQIKLSIWFKIKCHMQVKNDLLSTLFLVTDTENSKQKLILPSQGAASHEPKGSNKAQQRWQKLRKKEFLALPLSLCVLL